MNVKLGELVRDVVTGLTGTVVSIHQFLHGCRRITIQPPLKDGESKLPDTVTFDEPQLDVIGPGVSERFKHLEDPAEIPKKKPGGPGRYVDEGRDGVG